MKKLCRMLGAAAVLCAGLMGCAAGLLPALLAPQVATTVGVAGLSAASCAGDSSSCEPRARQCSSPTDRKLAVTEAVDVDIPANEGKVAAFTPAYWQPQFAQNASLAAVSAEANAGTFAITDKSIVFVPPPGVDGVHLPLVGVVNVELQQSSATGAARQLTVESCFGRLDRFTFGQPQNARQLDSKATADAAAEIKARIATVRPTAASK